MSDSPRRPVAFRLIDSPPGPRFLGLRVAERNRRVARRAGATDAADVAATLNVPANVAIGPPLFAAIPNGARRVVLRPQDGGPSIVWNDPAAANDQEVSITLPPLAAFDVTTAADRHRAAWALLRASGKPTDGWLSRHVHRRISRPFSYVCLLLGLSANIATFLTFGVGAAGAWLLAGTTHASMIGGALLYWCSSIADGIDGEMARLTLSESAFGEQLDTGVDQATHFLALTGAGIGWWRQGFGPSGLLLAAAVAVGAPAVLLWAMALVRRAKGTRAFFVVTKPIELAVIGAAKETGSLVLRSAAWIFVLFRREAFSFTFFVVSLLTGLRVVIPAIVAVALLVVAATFALYRAPLNRALVAAVRS